MKPYSAHHQQLALLVADKRDMEALVEIFMQNTALRD